MSCFFFFFFFQAEDGIRDYKVTGVQTCALPIFREVFEATQGDKDRIGQFALGLNSKVEIIGDRTDELALGTATIGIGANKGIGGENDSSLAFSGTLTRPTIDIDGTAIMVDGKLGI